MRGSCRLEAIVQIRWVAAQHEQDDNLLAAHAARQEARRLHPQAFELQQVGPSD